MFLRKKIALLFLICFAGQTFVQAQAYSTPKHLALKGNEEQTDMKSGRFGLLTEEFYPIGWSKDGKFAYYSEPADEACGCYFADLIIQDIRTDKILWTSHFEGGESEDITIKTLWRRKQKEFSRKLAQYGIVPNKNFTLLDSPLKTADDTVNVDLFSDVKLAEDAYSSEGRVIVKLLSKQKGAKIVYRKTYDGKSYDGIMNAELGGMLLSPFEPRIAVILIETRRGWEGPPHITNINIVGATLTGGFK